MNIDINLPYRFTISIIDMQDGKVGVRIDDIRNYKTKTVIITEMPSKMDTYLEIGEQIGNTVSELLLKKI